MGQRLYLIDGYSTIFRAFYAIRDLSNSKGDPTNAVYGFVQMLRKLLRDEAPDLVGVALDVGGPTVRSERYEEYKANRTPMPDDLRAQMKWIRQAIGAFRIPILELAGYEADDVLGTLARKAAEEGYEVVLVTADKDLMQLVSSQVKLLHTGRDKLYDEAGVEGDFGVAPEKVPDVLALMGDSVDNVPGVPGIGEKGARSLIREYGTLDSLLDHAAEVKRKSYREGLEQHREQAIMSRQLVTIHTDLDVPFDAEDLAYEGPDTDALVELYRELDFFSLLKELEAERPREARHIPNAEEALSPAEWESAVGNLGGRIALAAVGEDVPPVGLAVELAPGEVVFADFRRPEMGAAVRDSLARWLGDSEIELVGHDLKEVLRLAGSSPRDDPDRITARLVDSMLLAYLLRSAVRSYHFADVCLDRLQHTAITMKEAGWEGSVPPASGDPRLLAMAAERVVLGRELTALLEEELRSEDESGSARVYDEIEEPLIPVLVAMEEAGVALDVELLRSLSGELGARLETLEEEIYRLAGERFNINSPQQLGVILFDKLGYPVLKRTRKTRQHSTSAETLEELASRGYELPVKLLAYREATKLKSTYVDALPELVAEDGRLHTRFNQAVAATGRLSSANPNLQNIPVRTDEGRRIRQAFRAGDGFVLLVADYSQIELRVLAHIAQEDALVDAFRAGADIHASTASSVFGVQPELVTEDQRRAAKVINFGIIYGMSAYGLAQNLGISPKEARVFIDAYFERYPGVRSYTEETLESVEQLQYVTTLYGRRRWLPDVRSRNRALRENARRMAINARIQGTAADLLKLAMIAVDGRLAEAGTNARLLLTVHDELVLEVPSTETEKVATLVREEMEGVEDLLVPLVVDVGWGEDWASAKGG